MGLPPTNKQRIVEYAKVGSRGTQLSGRRGGGAGWHHLEAKQVKLCTLQESGHLEGPVSQIQRRD